MVHLDNAEVHFEYTNRKDRFSSIQDLEHSCIPPTGDIREYRNITIKEDPETDIDEITKLQILFAGKFNLSMASVTSKEFYALIIAAIKLGQMNLEGKTSSLFSQMSRNNFSTQFMELGNKIYNENLQNYMKYENNSLAIDAGKEGNKNYLDILLTNALVQEKPLLHEAFELFDGSFDSYYNAISDTILKLSTQNIKVSGLVCNILH